MKKLFVFILLPFLFSCIEDCPIGGNCVFDDLIESIVISKNTLIADGSDTSKITVTFIENADPAKAILNCKVSNGTIIESMSQMATIPGKRLIEDSPKKVVAEFNINSSTIVRDIEIDFEVQGFTTKRKIDIIPSTPIKVELSANKFSALNNFQDEVLITGQLFNDSNKKVSKGYTVKLVDSLDGNEFVGRFRNGSLTTGSTSMISVNYSAGEVEAGKEVILKVLEVNDINGNIIPIISNEILLYIRE